MIEEFVHGGPIHRGRAAEIENRHPDIISTPMTSRARSDARKEPARGRNHGPLVDLVTNRRSEWRSRISRESRGIVVQDIDGSIEVLCRLLGRIAHIPRFAERIADLDFDVDIFRLGLVPRVVLIALPAFANVPFFPLANNISGTIPITAIAVPLHVASFLALLDVTLAVPTLTVSRAAVPLAPTGSVAHHSLELFMKFADPAFVLLPEPVHLLHLPLNVAQLPLMQCLKLFQMRDSGRADIAVAKTWRAGQINRRAFPFGPRTIDVTLFPIDVPLSRGITVRTTERIVQGIPGAPATKRPLQCLIPLPFARELLAKLRHFPPHLAYHPLNLGRKRTWQVTVPAAAWPCIPRPITVTWAIPLP
ncbi:hypothetical protein [Maioricimonas sp. JC845]|uniref:hypothetical protein n=1 Tax=Maioricimonas sp. JC845 TaxID=3232138 RepID=UPI0034592CC2